jgi:cytochrome c
VLRFHASQVNAVAALPGGRFATAGEDGKVAIWGLAGGSPLKVLTGHAGPVASLTVSPDSEWLASASWDGTVRLWPLSGGEPRVLDRRKGNVNAAVFLADGAVASAGYDGALTIWPADGDPPSTLLSLASPLNTLAALPSHRIAVGSADGRVRIVGRDGGVLAEAQVAPTPVIALAASADGVLLAAAGLQGAVAVLDAATLLPKYSLVGPGLPVWSLAFTADGRTLLTGGSDRLVRRWDMATGAHLGSMVAGLPDPLAAYSGDPGAEVFRACVACHTLSADEGERAGPTLAGIFGRRIAALPDYRYSEALKKMDITWTPETVSKLFEVGPATYTPGTKMPEQRIGDAQARAALVKFLERATGAP